MPKSNIRRRPQGSKQDAVTVGPVVEVTEAAVLPTVSVDAPSLASDAPKSIRSMVRADIQAGRSTKEITARLAEFFPGTMAAAKSTKHIAYYRAQLKKEAALSA